VSAYALLLGLIVLLGQMAPCRAPEGIKEQRRGAGHRRLIGIYDV